MSFKKCFGLFLVCVAMCETVHAQGVSDMIVPGSSLLTKKKHKDNGELNVKLPPYFGPKKRIAVEDVEIKITNVASTDPGSSGGSDAAPIPPPTDFGSGLTEMLTTALVKSGRFIVLERTKEGIADMQKEQSLDGVNADSKVLASKLLGAQALVRGAVTEFIYHSSRSNGSGKLIKGLGLSNSKSDATVVINIKIFDAETGEVADSKKAEGTAHASSTNLNVDREGMKFGSSEFQQSPLGQATRQAIERAVFYICDSMDKRPWEGRVATVVDEGAGPMLYLNVGGKAGVKAGDEFDVFEVGQEVKDPDSGRVLSHTKGRRIGRCRVESVEEEISIAKPIEGEGFAAKDTVRFVEKDAKPDPSKPA